jgi:hypothetical protein
MQENERMVEGGERQEFERKRFGDTKAIRMLQVAAA